jgi:5,10-methylenetetrahydromethanopterin reductase
MSANLGVLLLGEHPMPRLRAMASRIEEMGYDSLWVADEKFYRDPFVSLAVVAQATQHIRLGTAVTEPYARHPALLAMAMGTIAELCPDRCILGLGAGGPGFPPMGVVRRAPARALREALQIIRGLLANQRVTLDGEVLSFHGGKLNFQAQPMPIYVAARGRQMLRAAGGIADGVIMAPFASDQAIAYASALVREGARAGSDSRQAAGLAPRPALVARVDVSIAAERDLARRAVRYFVALPVWVSYPDWGYVEALGIALPEQLRSLIARREYGDIAAAAELLPDAMLDHFAVAGTPEEVGDRLARLASQVDEVIIHPVAPEGATVEDVIAGVARIWKEIA